MTTATALTLGLLVLLLAALALIGVLHLARGTPVERVQGGDGGEPLPPPAIDDPAFLHTLSLLTRTALQPGHRVAVLPNGNATYPRLWDDLRAATRSIDVQLYYCQPSRVADELQAILIERARAGVCVRFLYDAFGSQHLPASYWNALRSAGVQVTAFRPIDFPAVLGRLHKAQRRSHVRIVVVDGRIGYTGGFGLDDKWCGNGRREGEWRDTNVRCVGGAAAQLQAAFAAAWAEATGTLVMGEELFPRPITESRADGLAARPGERTADGVTAGLLFATPTLGSTDAERFLAATIGCARRSLYVANGYFAPDHAFRRLLTDAAERGVDVRILTASGNSDIATLWYAGRARYAQLLEGGVRVYEYQPSMMHAKSLVADGCWAMVGSLSFDNRGLALNDETALLMHGESIGRQMDALFLDDLQHAQEIKLPEWRRRPWTGRVLEAGANLLSRTL